MPPPKKEEIITSERLAPQPTDAEPRSLLRKTTDIPSWIQYISANLARALLAFLCLVTAAFIIFWYSTIPSIADLQITKTQGVDLDKVFERFYAARRSHFNDYRDMYLLVIGTTLAPTLTLLLGHAFGQAQERGRAERKEEEGGDEA